MKSFALHPSMRAVVDVRSRVHVFSGPPYRVANCVYDCPLDAIDAAERVRAGGLSWMRLDDRSVVSEYLDSLIEVRSNGFGYYLYKDGYLLVTPEGAPREFAESNAAYVAAGEYRDVRQQWRGAPEPPRAINHIALDADNGRYEVLDLLPGEPRAEIEKAVWRVLVGNKLANFVLEPCRATALELHALHRRAIELGECFPDVARAVFGLLPNGAGEVNIAWWPGETIAPKLRPRYDRLDAANETLKQYLEIIRGDRK